MTFECEGYSKNDEDSFEERVEKEPSNEKLRVFSAKAFVDDLLENGSNIPCDNSIEEFNREGLPKFYNEVYFKRGQDFFWNNAFSLLFCKFLGLILTLSSPSILAVLKMTKMSGSPMTAYRRYVSTLFHLHLWYESELSSDSRSMRSMKRVKVSHNTASSQANSIDRPPITQKDMVLTQFGFMGFCIARTEFIGIHGARKEDLEGFVHFWKVIGSIMGIQDRFNLSRDSLEETREICEELINRVFRPFVEKRDPDFLEMTSYLTDGLWYADPQLNHRVFLSILYDILRPIESLSVENLRDSEEYFPLTIIERLYYRTILFGVRYMMKYNVVRIFLNIKHQIFMWILHRIPLLAVCAFGYENAIVSIESNHCKMH
ncbi:uncharacterized protein LOC123308123 [Coccinella septempunctata]|uniref:uncharacterized protein LOC123308123 n=1 Tax=Coccinella septempunctata TaxID=41139 RepID=UPI001D0925BB|nr:uncharacterized protein LOC123308123 [Coccinella septempunctata]XP_044746599.1 uncharacterized protein LOC123308123 [Coccinella septempunctata]XP_044746600.1 uncharacterized protein LOC123308123 [Coccinella septempunctata]XP_044746601.1 uncharacterized protein LOC123308123 [Coccinella septempunctata]XP_044746602.1 uncharacterized protein LOC123308123 [Coccinella septempunctata]XP_044746603.1 uncharacterized protein LOC123308123 [Coccinella septempunctata]